MNKKNDITYAYSYKLDIDTKNNKSEALPYLFDNREQMNSKEYLECEKCGACYPCVFEKDDKGIKLKKKWGVTIDQLMQEYYFNYLIENLSF